MTIRSALRFNPSFVWSTLEGQMTDQAQRLLRELVQPTGPVQLASYIVAGVPDATAYTSGIIYVSDETGGATLAFSDGTNWRRVQDRNVIS